MPRFGTGFRLIVVALLVGAGCATARSVPLDRTPSHERVTFKSPTLGYSWTLPSEWEFVPAEMPDGQHGVPAVEVTAARSKGDRRIEARAVVYNRLSVISGQWNTRPDDYDALERHGIELLLSLGARATSTRRRQMLGVQTVEVNGLVDTTRVSLRLLYRGRRLFQFRCVGGTETTKWPCESAFAALVIAELPDSARDGNTPRVLHLRDVRFGLAFDAPDDSWLAIGPSTGMNGAQAVWVWRNAGRQIDVQAADLSSLKSQPDVTYFVAMVVKQLESTGATVTIGKAHLAGRQCYHLEVSRDGGYQQDMFLLQEGAINYGLLVTQPTRDAALIDKAKTGFWLTVE